MIAATYINASQFSVEGDHRTDLPPGLRILCIQDAGEELITDVVSTSYSVGTGLTTVTALTDGLTEFLLEIRLAYTYVDDVGLTSNLAIHDHSEDYQGGQCSFALFTNDDIVDRLISVGGVSPSVADFVVGYNHTGTDIEKKEILGATNQITVTHSAGEITFSTPQDLDTGTDFSVGSLTISNTSGFLVQTDGLVESVSAGAGYFLRRSLADDAWEAVDFVLGNMSNIIITSPEHGDVLTYYSGSGKWRNAAPTGGGGGQMSVPFGLVVGLVTALCPANNPPLVTA